MLPIKGKNIYRSKSSKKLEKDKEIVIIIMAHYE
jgi:hypothetical protein